MLAASVFLLRSHSLSFHIDAGAALAVAHDLGAMDAEDHISVHLFLAQTVSNRQAQNELTVRRLRASFALALGGLVAELIGLGLGAAIA